MIFPYLNFYGDCKEAITFYEQAFRTNRRMLREYGDYVPAGLTDPPEDLANWVLHAEMEICGVKCWLADEALEPVVKGNQMILTVIIPNKQTAEQIYDVLKDGAHISLPPTKTFYSPFHAGLTDRFGISWNIVVETQVQDERVS